MTRRWLGLVVGVFVVLKIALALLGPVMVSTDNTSDAVWYLARAKTVAQTVRASYGSVVEWAILGYGQLLWMAIMGAALLGLAKMRLGREYGPHNVLYMLLILWGLFHTIFFGRARFNFPMFAVVAIAAAAWTFGLKPEAKIAMQQDT